MVQRSTVFIWTSWSCCGTRSKTAAREGASFSDICLVVLEQRSFYSYFVRLRSSHCKSILRVNVWFLLQTSTSADSGAVWCLCLNNSKTQLAVNTKFLRIHVYIHLHFLTCTSDLTSKRCYLFCIGWYRRRLCDFIQYYR